MAQTKSSKDYDKKNTKNFSLKLNYNTDADMIAYLEGHDNIQGFLKCLISAHMYRNTGRLMEEKQ